MRTTITFLRRQTPFYLLYLLVALVVTYPLLTQFSTHLAGHPFSDSYEMIRHIWWLKHAIETGQPLFQQPLLAYPNGLDGTLLWSYPLQSFPAWLFAFVMPLPAAYNLMIILRLAFNGWAAFFLARHLTNATLPGVLGGLVFMTYSSFQGHLGAGHVGLLALGWLPLYVFALFRLYETDDRRWMLRAALFFVLSLAGSTQLLIFTLLPVTVLFIVLLLARRAWSALRKTLIAAAAGAVASLIFAVPLLLTTLNEPTVTDTQTGVVDYSDDLLGVVAPSFYHPLFRANPLSVAVIGVDPFEGAAYVGIVVAILCVVAIITQRQSRWWLVLALVAWVFSLGPVLKLYYQPLTVNVDGYDTYITLPWAAFYNLPVINITRTPGRFDFTLGLAVAMLAAFGMARITRFTRRYRWLNATLPLVLIWVVFEYQFWWGLPTIPGTVPAAISDLRDRDDIRAVYNLPWYHLLAGKEALWLQTGHQQPMVAGHMTRQTPVDPAKLSVLQETLDPALLDAAGVDAIILHKDYDDVDGYTASFTRDRLGDPVYEDDRFALFMVEHDAGAAAGFLAVPMPPVEEVVTVDRYASYVYTQRAVDIRYVAEVEADERAVLLLLNGAVINRWTVAEEVDIDETISLPGAGYYTLELALDPPCPFNYTYAPLLSCRAMEVDDVGIDPAATDE